MNDEQQQHSPFWRSFWKQFHHYHLGQAALFIVILFCLAAIYAPLLASSKPLFVKYQGEWYFPLFRYLFYPHFFTKKLDVFYNLLMFTFPLGIACWLGLKKFPSLRKWSLLLIIVLQLFLFLFLIFFPPKDPAADPALNRKLKINNKAHDWNPNWSEELSTMNDYAKLNLILSYRLMKEQQQTLEPYAQAYAKEAKIKDLPPQMPTLWQKSQDNLKKEKARAEKSLATEPENMKKKTEIYLNYLNDKETWMQKESNELTLLTMPLLRPFHWEDDAGGSQTLNKVINWWNLTRINRKDLVAGLIFGIRISLSVGILSISLALLIGIPIGAFSGYYGGTLDIITYRLIEVWESMPTFFILLFIVAFLQTKSIFVVMAVIGFFDWTGFSRFIRGEFFKQKQMSYVEAAHSQGFKDSRIIFSHLLPNAIPPLLTLVPFAILGAITSEAGLSFLGLGEEGSCSWGVLMDEGKSVFPAESYLLWPPAILLTVLLVAIALVGDTLRDVLDPKMQ